MSRAEWKKFVPRHLQPAIQAALDAGWSWKKKTKHTWLLAPDGKTTVSVPGSPSDIRSLYNTRSELRRAGVSC
ncbi:hypothetical protein [Amycolatopsis thermophila]|uniref:HicA toxin of toxin-antitoxin n=1 Tax=Amycolatopsis thermophila TaxID=206084 RepID=A0ABU0ENK7_9PSEU|nr:hypothetical protein [Amycolatopsis thermophila]MDQ0376628.1 hypothetical protein [Amycolatopsis thermophila]